MRLCLTRFIDGLVLLFFAAAAAQPAWATLPTPNQPVLLVQDTGSADPYQNFVPELLTTEGLNGFQVAQLTDLTSTFLSNYDVIILPHLTLTAAQAALFQNYVNAGGTLVGFRPDLQLASVFGVASLGTTLPEAWLKIDTTTPYAPSSDSEAMKFHGTADLYSLNGASALATLYSTATLSTTSPAAAINNFGLGKAILLSFDLTQSIVLMRQGNPAWAGYPNTHDGYNTMRASGMFMDKNSGQNWNDLGDGSLNDVPQADIQLRLFSNAVTLTNAAKRPLPRLWYYPNQNRSLLLFTGDHHGDDVNNSISEISAIQFFGGRFSEFLWYPFGPISNTQANTWLAAGHTVGVHFDDTAESDSSGMGGSAASWNGMQSVINNALTSFATNYPSAPAPVTTRNHFLIWVSNDANGTVDPVAQAKLFQNNGIQLDTSYTAFPNRWGYMTGSGLPMKFLDATTGAIIPVFEQATQYEDDIQLGSVAYSTNWSLATAQTHYQKSLSESLTKYNTVVTMLFHPDAWSGYQSYAQTVLQYAQSNSIPMYTTGAWLQFWKGRAATTVSNPTFASNALAFTATGSPAGLTLLVPNVSGNNVVSTFQVDGATQSLTVAAYQGVMYASVVLTAGTHSVSVTYTPAGRILGQISPSAAAASTTIQVQSGSITQSVSPAADGTYAAGPLPAGTYTVMPASSGYMFSPPSQSVTLGTADVTNVNFTATANTAGQTLFTTQTPVLTDISDGAGANYELGTAFTSDVPGQIAAVRFWKAPSESGTHTGNIWSSTGQLLASVAFANESASGWQKQVLGSPLSVAANTTYVVSVNTGNSFYVASPQGLANQVVNQDLSSVVGNNGVFASPGQFPNLTFNGNNYFRDIEFIPQIYSISGAITPAASASGATVTLSGASNPTTTVDSSGIYSFTGLANGSYTVTPSEVGIAFNPASQVVTVSGVNVTGINFTAITQISFISLNPTSVAGGIINSTGTVTLGAPAVGTSAQRMVTLSSDNPAAATVPATVTVAIGATSANFKVTSLTVATTSTANISVTFNGASQAAALTVTPLPRIVSLALNPTSVPGGITNSIGTVTLDAPAVGTAAQRAVTLSSDNPAAATVPATVTVASGATSASFTVTSLTVAATSTANVTGTSTSNGASQAAVLTVTPPPGVVSLALNPISVVGGSANSTATLTLNAPAAGTNAQRTVMLSSDTPAAATVPASVIVVAGATTATFTVTSKVVSTVANPAITATLNGSANATLTVNPVVISSVALSPTSVTGGIANSIGTVTLNVPAVGTTAQRTVTVSSDNTAAATVPATVTVAIGATSANFTVTSHAVITTNTATISGSINGSKQSAVLTVTR
jgi:hypothetical protein